MDNISLESMFHWISDDTVRFKIELGVEEKCTKMKYLYHAKWIFRSMPRSDDVIIMAMELHHHV